MSYPTKTEATKPRTAEQQSREWALEIGLEDTFPASDPVAVIEPGPPSEPSNDEPER